MLAIFDIRMRSGVCVQREGTKGGKFESVIEALVDDFGIHADEPGKGTDVEPMKLGRNRKCLLANVI